MLSCGPDKAKLYVRIFPVQFPHYSLGLGTGDLRQFTEPPNTETRSHPSANKLRNKVCLLHKSLRFSVISKSALPTCTTAYRDPTKLYLRLSNVFAACECRFHLVIVCMIIINDCSSHSDLALLNFDSISLYKALKKRFLEHVSLIVWATDDRCRTDFYRVSYATICKVVVDTCAKDLL